MNIIIFVIFCLLLGVLAFRIFVFLQKQKLLKTVTKPNRGTTSERELVIALLKNGFPSQDIFHDLYLKNKIGKYTQIDLVVVTDVGIIVFEIKDYNGWIFGTGNQKYWTQVLAYGRQKYRFYNPILQNRKHIFDLKNSIPQDENIPSYSVVVFFGNCEFRDITAVPSDVILVQSWNAINVVTNILLDNPPVTFIDKSEIASVLQSAVNNGDDRMVKEEHIRNIESMLNANRRG